MTPTLFHSKMFDVGDLPVLTFGNCVLKNGVIKWPLKLYVSFLTCFFSKSKNTTFFTFFELLTTFSQHTLSGMLVLLQAFNMLHLMHHEATACHVTEDIVILLTLITQILDTARKCITDKKCMLRLYTLLPMCVE